MLTESFPDVVTQPPAEIKDNAETSDQPKRHVVYGRGLMDRLSKGYKDLRSRFSRGNGRHVNPGTTIVDTPQLLNDTRLMHPSEPVRTPASGSLTELITTPTSEPAAPQQAPVQEAPAQSRDLGDYMQVPSEAGHTLTSQEQLLREVLGRRYEQAHPEEPFPLQDEDFKTRLDEALGTVAKGSAEDVELQLLIQTVGHQVKDGSIVAPLQDRVDATADALLGKVMAYQNKE